jgi:hypothetical protein
LSPRSSARPHLSVSLPQDLLNELDLHPDAVLHFQVLRIPALQIVLGLAVLILGLHPLQPNPTVLDHGDVTFQTPDFRRRAR